MARHLIEEIELVGRAEVVVLERSIVNHFAYYLRATEGTDPYDIEPFVRRWSQTYDLQVRLRPDVPIRPDGIRSTNESFRDEIDAILDRILPSYVSDAALIELPASEITSGFDWSALLERLVGPSVPSQRMRARFVRLTKLLPR